MCVYVCGCVYTLEFYSVIKEDEIMLFSGKWLKLESILPREIS